MSKKKKPQQKLKKSLNQVIRSLFKKNKDSVFTHKQVCTLLDLREGALRKLAFNILEDLVKSEYLKNKSYGVYQLNINTTLIEGRVQMTARGAAFIIPTKNDIEDIFIPPAHTNRALDGDLVHVQITKKGGKRQEGTIVDVLEREKTQFVGEITLHEHFAFFRPDNERIGTDIYISKENINGAKTGDKVLVKMLVWPNSSDSPSGSVVEVLGSSNLNDIEMIGILVNQGLNYTFPQEVISEAEKISDKITEQELGVRKDLRETLTFTIDPEDAKDFDDALSYKELENGNIELGVHIADVSHFVRPGTEMDKEALHRSNSVYLVDRVVPMLPEQLSNKICSLRPNEDKYTFSAIFELDSKGKVIKEWFGKTVIHSDRRFTYEEAQEIITSKKGELAPEILVLDKIAKILRKKRLNDGAMNIESEEVRFKLDAEGMPDSVIVKRSQDAHKLIEEYMLLANKRVANFIGNRKEKKVPFVYRCHDDPSPEKIAQFTLFIRKFGFDIDVTQPKMISKNINSLLSEIRQNSEFSIVQSMAIRSMAKATYETQNIGHYGLGFEYYSHFTSPIRRYADLIVHRILQEELTTKKHSFGKGLDDICKRISRMERKAVDAERESTKYFQTLFMIDKIDETFSGTISGMTEYGIFIKIDEILVEGFCPHSSIKGDRYHFDKESYSVKSKKGVELNLGDPVKVMVYEVNPRKRQIELEVTGIIRD